MLRIFWRHRWYLHLPFDLEVVVVRSRKAKSEDRARKKLRERVDGYRCWLIRTDPGLWLPHQLGYPKMMDGWC